jgi:hypothetical protein
VDGVPIWQQQADQLSGVEAPSGPMRSQRVEALEEVADDLRSAKEFYASWRSDGAAYFHQQFEDTIAWIAWNPELFRRKYRFFRRAIIRNTYFGIFYAIEREVTTIVWLWLICVRMRKL